MNQINHLIGNPVFQQVTNALTAPLCAINEHRQILYYNNAFTNFFKDKIRNTIGFELNTTSLCQFVGCQGKSCIECGIHECFKARQPGKILCLVAEKWIEITASPVLGKTLGTNDWAMCIFVDVSNQKKMEEQIKRSNIALTELLTRLEQERKDAKINVMDSITKMITPILEKMMVHNDNRDFAILLKQSIELACQNFGIQISTNHIHLTPREIELCAYIRTGIPTKDIAKAMGTSVRTVENQRKSLRKKLGLNQKADNLVSYLRQSED